VLCSKLNDCSGKYKWARGQMKVHVGWPMCNPVYIHLFIWWISLGLILVLFSAGPVSAQRNPIVDQIIIEGNTAIDSERIRSLMINKSGGLIRKNRLNFSDLIGDLEAIENVYRNSGFLDVRARQFQNPNGVDHVLLRIVIDEGPRYTVKKVNLIGFNHLEAAEIRRNLLTREGQSYFRLLAAADKRNIQALANRNALLDVRIDMKPESNPIDHSITLNFFIVEGEPIRVGEIQVRGLQKTQRYVVIRELEIKPGDLYDNNKLARSQTRLFQTGLFRSARMEPIRNDSSSTTRDLLVSVTELPSGEFSFGGGFASVERFRASYSLAYRNWLGRAITIGTNGQISELLQQVDAGVSQPWLFETRTTGTLRGFFTRRNRISHIEREIGIAISASREISRAFRGQSIYTLKQVKILSLSDSLTQILQSGSVADSLRSRREGSLTQVILYDTRDDILSPSTGFLGQIQVNIASPLLGSSSQNKNSTLTLSALIKKYIPIQNFPDFATSFSISYVRALGHGLIPLDKILYAGGDRSVRGFSIDQIGQPEGGAIAVSSQNEIRISLSGVVLAGFIDWGGVGKTVGSFDLDDIQVGLGGGLRVTSPIGLIRGDIGFHNKGDLDNQLTTLYDRIFFYFGLGQAF